MGFDSVFIMKYADEFISSSKLPKGSKHRSKIGIVIPTLNEEKSIGLVINELKRELAQFDFVIIVVDGRSTDRTISVAKENGAEVIYQKNKGYGEALIAGYFYAVRELQCDILVTIDADGTYSAKDCFKVINKIESLSADYVVGRRLVNSKNMTFSHRIGNRIISWLIRNFLEINIMDTQSGLFGFRSYLTDNIDLGQIKWAINTELLTKALELGMNIDEVGISYSERIGKTKSNTIRAGLTNLQMIIRMIRDFKPLLILGSIGATLVGVGIIFGGIVIYDFYKTGTIHHSSSAVLSALLIIAGVQLVSLGLVADMLRRKQQTRLKLAHNLYSKDRGD